MENVKCSFVRFSKARAFRSVGAAEVEIDGDLLWMTKSDIAKNIKLFGELPGLLQAREAYKTPHVSVPNPSP